MAVSRKSRASRLTSRGDIKIAKPGRYVFSNVEGSICVIAGKEYNNTLPSQEPVKDVFKLDKGVYPIRITYAGRGATGLAYQFYDSPGSLHALVKQQGKNEIAGFVWWQEHKDRGEPHASRYEQNLVHLVRTLRKEFDAPKAPFVVATIGFSGWQLAGAGQTIANAQLAVGDPKRHAEFAGNVKSVETRDFWRKAEGAPKNQGFRYNQNAETYYLVGDAMGKAMVELLNK